MSIDIKTTSIEQKRTTFEHIEKKLGAGRAPTRYQEVMFGLQHEEVFHYRPTWDPEHEIFDARRTAIKMQDFQDLLDPRQYYYGAYVIQRSKQQESQEKNFSVVEKRNLLDGVSSELKEKIAKVVIPFRHFEWGANTNNLFIAAYGFETPVSVAADFQGMDRLGNAQYITRIGLIMSKNDPEILDIAKSEWLESPMWQPLRKIIEDSFVIKDWFELHVLQNYLLDGLFHPLIFESFENDVVNGGGSSFAMLTEFFVEWYAESVRWTDGTIKAALKESDENKVFIEGWLNRWKPEVIAAANSIAGYAFAERATEVMQTISEKLDARSKKIGISL